MKDRIRGSDLVVQTLEAAGVEKIFTLSGNHVMVVFDASLDTRLELIHVRHEGAAVHMADAWSRLTGQIGVALVTGGPGHANAVSAMYTAMASESSLLLISGHAPLDQLGQGAFQEMAQAEVAAPLSKASWVANDPETVDEDIARAIRIARSGRPGPVHVSLPVDVLDALVDVSPAREPLAAASFDPIPQKLRDDTASTLMATLAGAQRPLILAGPAMGCAVSRDALAQLQDATAIPVVVMESPRGINDPSLGAFAQVLAEADCIALLGKQPDFTLAFGRSPAVSEDCAVIQIDPDPLAYARASKTLGERPQPVHAVVADAVPASQALARAAQSADWMQTDWRDRVDFAVSYRPDEWDTFSSADQEPLHPVEICRAVQKVLDAHPNATLVADGGEFGQWSQACLNAAIRVINGPAGAIGSALPFAVAARLANPDAPVIAMLGDGTVGFHLAEFDTAVRYGLPFIAVIGNDACWNAEYQIQMRAYGPDRLVGCELLSTHYEKAAEGLGAYGEYVCTGDTLSAALERALESGCPACINVLIKRVPVPVVRSERLASI